MSFPVGLTAEETALWLPANGFWSVVLYHVGYVVDGKETKGKEPIVEKWGLRRPSQFEIEKLFRQWPKAGVGLTLGPGKGPDGRWLIDIEGDGVWAEDSLKMLLGGEIVQTRWLGFLPRQAPSLLRGFEPHGETAWSGLPTSGNFPQLPGLELRGFGHGQAQSAVPPTVGEDRKPREWHGCQEIALFPRVAYEFLEGLSPGNQAMEANRVTPARRDPGRAGMGITPYGSKALADECDKVVNAAPRASHNAMRTAALKLRRLELEGHLSEREWCDCLADGRASTWQVGQ